MATPSSRPHSNSTPKNHPVATPTHFISSPHPSTSAAMARGLSHKSPSIKTPASLHGHSYHISTSSQPASTPLAAATSIDDVTMSSPSAALLAMGISITPSPAPVHGLAATGHNMQGIDMSGLGLAGGRDNEEERMRNMREVVRLIGTRAVPRGVSREGAELVGRSVGADCMWDDNTLNIAGIRTLVEVEFDRNDKGLVNGVSLSFPTSVGGGSHAEKAATVLKEDLTQSDAEKRIGKWKSMRRFKANLERIARLDRLSAEVNCFEAVEGLYECFQKIWDDERKRKAGSIWQALCRGPVGRPVIHKEGTIGLGLEYWVENHRRLTKSDQQPPADHMDVDGQPSRDSDQAGIHVWTANLECEYFSGEMYEYQSVRVSNKWVSKEVFKAFQNDASSGNSQNQINSDDQGYVDWLDPLDTFASPSQDNPDAMVLDSSILDSHKTPDVRFVAKFDPPVLVPSSLAYQIFHETGGTLLHEAPYKNFEYMAFPEFPQPFKSTSGGIVMPPIDASRNISIFDSDDNRSQKRHVYKLYTQTKHIGHYLKEIPFSHPRQLSRILPSLRQYILLLNILRNTLSSGSARGLSLLWQSSTSALNTFDPQTTEDTASFTNSANGPSSIEAADQNGTRTITNKPPQALYLDSLLNKSSSPPININSNSYPTSAIDFIRLPTIGSLPSSSVSSSPSVLKDRPVDITLSMPDGDQPSISIMAPVSVSSSKDQSSPSLGRKMTQGSQSPPESDARTDMLHIAFQILPNGIISVQKLRIPGLELDGSSNASATASSRPDDRGELERVRRKWFNRVSRAIEMCAEAEDDSGGLGVVVESIWSRAEKEVSMGRDA